MIYKPLSPINIHDKWNVTSAIIDKNFRHLYEIDQEQKLKGELLHRYFSVTVADGKAFYQITKITKTSASVVLCEGINPDNYCDPILGLGSVLPVARAKALIRTRDNLEQIFPVTFR